MSFLVHYLISQNQEINIYTSNIKTILIEISNKKPSKEFKPFKNFTIR
jgi:hypothetical protein